MKKANKLRNVVLGPLPAMAPQVTIDMISRVHEDLDDQLLAGDITYEEYEAEWRSILHAVGWTEEMYEREVDRRWEYVDDTRDLRVYDRSYGKN